MNKASIMLVVVGGSLLCTGEARAHVSATPTAFAAKSGVIEFNVGHGCEGSDTYAVTVDIPPGVTSVRPMRSDFGTTSITVDPNDPTIVTSVTWQKADADALPADTNFYRLAIRAKAPDAPFTTVYYRAHQVCRAADATLSYVDWAALPGEVGEPAAAQNILPARLPGWNKYAVPVDIADLSVFFPDALIVWRGTDAYSFNDSTVELINTTGGVGLLAINGVKANDEIWVRY